MDLLLKDGENGAEKVASLEPSGEWIRTTVDHVSECFEETSWIMGKEASVEWA
jgi:hypothetical protein